MKTAEHTFGTKVFSWDQAEGRFAPEMRDQLRRLRRLPGVRALALFAPDVSSTNVVAFPVGDKHPYHHVEDALGKTEGPPGSPSLRRFIGYTREKPFSGPYLWLDHERQDLADALFDRIGKDLPSRQVCTRTLEGKQGPLVAHLSPLGFCFFELDGSLCGVEHLPKGFGPLGVKTTRDVQDILVASDAYRRLLLPDEKGV